MAKMQGSDQSSFETDPDPALWAKYRSGSGSNPDPVTKNWKEFTAENFFYLDQKLQFTYP
jgi:hypothetical protein